MKLGKTNRGDAITTHIRAFSKIMIGSVTARLISEKLSCPITTVLHSPARTCKLTAVIGKCTRMCSFSRFLHLMTVRTA